MFIINWCMLYWSHVRSSLKNIFIIAIGLIFIIAIIASTLIYITSAQVLIFNSFTDKATYTSANSNNSHNNSTITTLINGYQPIYPDIQLYVELSTPMAGYDSFFTSVKQEISSYANSLGVNSMIGAMAISTYMFGSEIYFNTTQSSVSSGMNLQGYSNSNQGLKQNISSIIICEISPDIKLELQSLVSNSGNGSFPRPQNNTEAFLLNIPKIHSAYENITPVLDDTAQLFGTFRTPVNTTTGSILTYSDKYLLNITAFTHIQQLSYTSYPHLVQTLVNINPGFASSGGMVLFVNNLSILYNALLSPYQNNTNLYSDVHLLIDGTISLNYGQFNPFNAINNIYQFNRFITILGNSIYAQLIQNLPHSDWTGLNPPQLHVSFLSETSLINAATIENSVSLALVLFAIPIIFVSLFVANYSFGLIRRRITQFIGIYKTRGSSNALIIFLLSLDFLPILLIAVISGFILGIPIAYTVLHTDNFLSFNGFPNASLIINLVLILPIIIISGIIIGSFLHLTRIFKLSTISIAESENPNEIIEPFWKQHYLDVFLSLIGGLGLFVYNIVFSSPTVTLSQLNVFFLSLLLMFVVGIILLISRLFPIALNKISVFLWEYNGNLLAFTLKNVSRHKQASTRAILLIAILSALLITFLSVPYSFLSWQQTNVEYNVGADAVALLPNISPNNYYNASLIHILETKYSKYFLGVSPFLLLHFRSLVNTSLRINFFLAINTSTFLSTAIIPLNLGTDNSETQEMDQLDSNNSATSIMVQEKTMNYRQAKIGGKIFITPQYGEALPFTIVDSYTFWPRLYTQNNVESNVYNFLSYNGNSVYGVMSIEQFLRPNFNIRSTWYQLSESGIYLKFKPDVNQTQVAQWLEGNFSLSMTLLSTQINANAHNILGLVIIGQINGNLLMSFIIGFSILVMFAWMQLEERKKEIYTERALGMKLLQLSGLFIIELLVLMLSGIIVGSVMGFELSQFLQSFVTQGPTFIPYQIIYPMNLIFECFTLLFILALGGAIFPAYKVSRQDISSSFAAER